MINLERFTADDIDDFLRLAFAEQWITGRNELEFLLKTFPDGCFRMRDRTAAVVGYVTSLAHDRGGWIGNLIVRPDRRGRGVGPALFTGAAQALYGAGVETIWLTASEMGRPLYERHGFKTIGGIQRWIGDGRGGAFASESLPAGDVDVSLDHFCWGDRRETLLRWVSGKGRIVSEAGAFAVLQSVNAAVQLGPWAALDSAGAGRILARALAITPAGTKVICDAPCSNTACLELLQEWGFVRQGETRLMYAGVKPAYRPACLYGLATLGSSG